MHSPTAYLKLLLLILLLYIPKNSWSNSIKLSEEFRSAYLIKWSKPDSAYTKFEKILVQAKKETDTLIIVECLQFMAEINFDKMNYAQALHQNTEALFFAEKAKITLQTSRILSGIGKIYNMLGKHDIGYEYMKRSHNLLVDLDKNEEVNKGFLISSYQMIAGMEREKKNYLLALQYLDSCFALSQRIKLNKISIGHLMNEKAKNLLHLKQPDASLEHLLPYEMYIDSLTSKTKNYSKTTSLIILLQHNIAKAYLAKDQNQEALEYLNKALVSIEQHGEHKGRQPLILESIANIQQQEGKYSKAYHNLKRASELNKHYFNVESEINSEVIELKDSYKEELDRKKQELIEQNLVVAQQEQSIYRFRALMAFVLLALSVSFFIFRSYFQKSKYKHQEELNLRKEEEQNAMIRYKQKELTSYSLQLIERDDLLDKFSELITKEYQTKSSRKLLQERKQLNSNNWDEFNKRFIEVNSGFYDSLHEKFPELTPNDLKHCALIKLNFSCKEMARILNISENSAQMARYRVRKKLGIPTETNLNTYLAEF